MLGRLKLALRPFRLYRAVSFGYHFAVDPVFRRDHLLYWKRPANLFQFRTISQPDRYPEIFEFARGQLADRPAPRLLSFGCALGDEVFSLRRYFPTATIKGIDINPGNIAVCRRRHREGSADPGIEFECTDSAAGEEAGTYDAVFCFAVFVRGALKKDTAVATCLPHLKFADFQRTSAGLARTLRPGGVLLLRRTMFRFADTDAGREFELVLSMPTPEHFFPRFDRENRRLPDSGSEEVAFVKRGEAGA